MLIERSKPLEGEVLTDRDAVRVVGSLHALRNDTRRIEVPAGLSIAEAIDLFIEHHGARPGIRDHLTVWLGDHQIPKDIWPRVRPKPGTTILFRPVLQGSDVLRTILGFGVAIAALFVAPLLAPALAGALGIGTGLATALVGGAITLGGKFLINALFPVRPPQIQPDETTKSLLSIAGARNELRVRDPIPVVLGTHRISPPYAAKPYTERVGADIYLRALFCPGYGPLYLTDYKLGETAIASFDEVTTESFQGYSDDNSVRLYPTSVDQTDLSVLLLNADSWQSRTTGEDVDYINVDVEAPAGVFAYNKDTGARDTRTVTVTVAYRVAGSGAAFTTAGSIVFTRSIDAVRKGLGWSVTRGQYEIFVRRATADGVDTDSIEYVDEVYWTALRGFTAEHPVSFEDPLALVAMRIRATDQLNGAVDTFNLLASSIVTAFNGSLWVAGQISSNPADLYRHVLQMPANKRPVADAAIDFDSIEAWWQFCDDEGFTCNMVVADRRSVYDVLADVAACGRATPAFIDGKWGVVWDNPDAEIAWHLTPRTSWGFSWSIPYKRLPHGLRVTFINANRSYAEDERIVYDDGYDETTAELFEGVEFPGVTDPSLIWRHGRYQIAQARLRPARYTLFCGILNLRFRRGDRVRITHDILLVGLAAGRVKEVAGLDLTLDTVLTMESGTTYVLRIQKDDGQSALRTLITTVGEYSTVTLVDDGSPSLTIDPGDLFAFGPLGQDSLVARVLDIEPQRDFVAKLTLVDDAAAILDADTGTIPAYDPGISLPPDPFTLPPSALRAEEKVSGTGITAKAYLHLSWQVARFGTASAFEIQAKDVDAGGSYVQVATVPAPQAFVDIYEVEAGEWEFRVRTLFADGTASTWVESGSTVVSGLLDHPADVQDFYAAVIGDLLTLSWRPNIEVNLSHYQIRYSTAVDGSATWGSAVTLVARQESTSVQVPTRAGSYLIKAVTFQEMESLNATAIVSVTEGSLLNVVETLTEHPTFPGLKDGVSVSGAALELSTGGVMAGWDLLADVVTLAFGNGYDETGTYYFEDTVDLGAVYTSRISASVEASGNDLTSVMSRWTSLEDVAALDTTDAGDWQVTLYYRYTDEDPAGSPVAWSDWIEFVIGDVTARAFQFKAVLSGTPTISPLVSGLSVTVDMPDRIDSGNDTVVPAVGLRVTFSPAFRATPSITITGHDMDATAGETVVLNQATKDATGFDVQILDSAGVGVERTIDWIARGYGRVGS